MAPSFQDLPQDGIDDHDEDEIDFSDLREAYNVHLEEGLDTFVVVDGLPVVPEDSRDKLIKFVGRKLASVGKLKGDMFMPADDSGKTQGYAFVEYESPSQAAAAIKQLHGVPLDKRHTMAVNKLTDIDRYGNADFDDEYQPPVLPDFNEKEHLRWWVGDGRDQLVMYRNDMVGVFWNEKEEAMENCVDREHWTEAFVQWSPQGTYLTSVHSQGVQLWAGPSWTRHMRFAHPGVNLVDYSPNENFLVTWSHRPLTVDENHPFLSIEDDGKNYILWDIATGKPLRSFVTLDLPGPSTDPDGNPVKKKIQWPAFKWSADDKYVARMIPAQSVSVYELPRMNLLDKQSIKIEGVIDFEWSPSTPQRDGKKDYEQLFCFWTPELGSNPAKVGLMSIPSKEIVRTRNLFNVSDAKLHWQSDAKYVCVKVDRHSKSKKSLATNLEIFRVQEKGVPVEVVDAIKDTVINFAWEPHGDRFVLITAGEVPVGAAVPPKTSVSFFCPEKVKPPAMGNFKLIKTIDKKNSNAIYWSPKGRFVVVATVHSNQSFDLDFWDLDFEGEKDEKDKDLTANLQLMATGDHYGVTDIEWDPSGRFVITSASVWKHQMENGYHLYDFKGELLREEPVEKIKQLLWRPRPATMLPKDEQKRIRKNLREYSRVFDQEDEDRKNTANREVVDRRRRALEEWLAWRRATEEDLEEERLDLGLERLDVNGADAVDGDDAADGEYVEEIVEEIIDESEEVVT